MSLNNIPCERDLNTIRGEIMDEVAKLLWKIKILLIPPTDGPSSDDVSSATVMPIRLSLEIICDSPEKLGMSSTTTTTTKEGKLRLRRKLRLQRKVGFANEG